MCRHNLKAGLLCALLSLPCIAPALERDSQQPLYIQADEVELDNRQGRSTYRGHVIIDQGSLHIEAQQLVIQRKGEELELIEAVGEPVRFRQRPEAASHDIEGEAARVEYHASEARLLLQGSASVQQGGDRFEGARIEYDTRRSVVSASSEGGNGGRVHAIIQPRSGQNGQAGNGEKQP